MTSDLSLWLVFAVLVTAMLAIDLGALQRRAHRVRTAEAVGRSAVWIVLALGFGLLVLAARGPNAAAQYATAYLIEETLSIDNIFVFVLIFTYFSVPAQYEHRVLFWGVISAVVLRAVFIAAGVAAIHQAHWLTYVLGAILVYGGIKLMTGHGRRIEPGKNFIVRLAKRWFPFTDEFDGGKFFLKRSGKWLATPLLLVLAAIETTDILFALDSVPAVLAITTDPLIAYTSNIFAVAGLRSLYFALAGILPRFYYLQRGLAVVLVLVGCKLLVAQWYRPPVLLTLALVVLILVTAAAIRPRKPRPEPTACRGGRPRARPPTSRRLDLGPGLQPVVTEAAGDFPPLRVAKRPSWIRRHLRVGPLGRTWQWHKLADRSHDLLDSQRPAEHDIPRA